MQSMNILSVSHTPCWPPPHSIKCSINPFPHTWAHRSSLCSVTMIDVNRAGPVDSWILCRSNFWSRGNGFIQKPVSVGLVHAAEEADLSEYCSVNWENAHTQRKSAAIPWMQILNKTFRHFWDLKSVTVSLEGRHHIFQGEKIIDTESCKYLDSNNNIIIIINNNC